MDFLIGEPTTVEESEAPKHGGLFYRVRESMYYSQSSGVFHKKLSLTPRKRKSCKDCK